VVFITNYSAYAINAATGNILWSTASFNYDLYSPTVANGKLYFGGFVGGLLCLDAATGRQIWNANTGIMRSNPALHNGVVYVGGEGAKIMSFDTLTGTQKWAYMNGGFGSPGSATGNEQSVFIGAYDSKLYSFDKSTGAVQWSLPSLGVSIGNGGLFYSPVAANGMVYSANSDKVVYAVDAATGTLNWKFGVYDSNGSSSFAEISNVTFANGVLFTGNPDGNLYALDANTGSVKWKFTTNGAVYSGACVLDAKGNIFHPGISGDQQ
jgi:eukaryotic-like serine/threonine-protein kinase